MLVITEDIFYYFFLLPEHFNYRCGKKINVIGTAIGYQKREGIIVKKIIIQNKLKAPTVLKTMEYISGKLKTERGCKGQESNGSKKKGQN